jgi:hypothetical protein
MRLIHVMVTALVAPSGCGVTQLPPPSPPAQLLSAAVLPAEPPPPGETTVVIDSDAPAGVAEVTGTVVGVARGGAMVAEELRPVCLATPCAVHLPRGPHTLEFASPDGTRGGHGVVEVGPDPSAYRYALGNTRPSRRTRDIVGIVASVGGLVAETVGVGLLEQDSKTTGVDAAPAAALAIGGVGAMVVALVLVATGHTTQNGAGTQWPIAPDAAAR